MKKYYLAYGSNLNLNHMAYRCPNAKPIGTINLNDYRLVYKGSADEFAYLTIEECEGYTIPLGLFEITNSDIPSLDMYEGYPELYSKQYVSFKLGNSVKKALIYVMNPNFDYHLPSENYIEICMQGYEDFGFDKAILERAYIDTINELHPDFNDEKGERIF